MSLLHYTSCNYSNLVKILEETKTCLGDSELEGRLRTDPDFQLWREVLRGRRLSTPGRLQQWLLKLSIGGAQYKTNVLQVQRVTDICYHVLLYKNYTSTCLQM